MTCNKKIQMESRATPESNEDCKCGRGQKVKFYCDQENCEKHKDNLFFCDYCFNEIMKKREPHFILQIPYLLQDLSSAWDELIDIIKKLQEQLAAHYTPQKELIASLEQTALNQPFSGRLVHRDMERFQKFHEEFQQIIPVVRGYIEENNVGELQQLKGQCTSFGETYQREFEYLMEIGKPTFIFDNYKPCIEKCLIPFYPEESLVRDQLLSLKVKLGQQNIANAQNAGKSHFSNEELAEAVSQLSYKVSVQEAWVNAFASLVGDLQRGAVMVGLCINNQQRGGVGEQLKIIAEQIAQLQEDSKKQSLLQQQVQDLQNSLEFQPQSLQYIQEGIIDSLKLSLSLEFQDKIEKQIITLKDSTNQELKETEERHELVLKNIEQKIVALEEYVRKELRMTVEKFDQLHSKIDHFESLKEMPLAYIEESKEDFAMPISSIHQKQTSDSIKIETFTQSGLDNFLQHIRHQGHDKLVDTALLHGLSLLRLNQFVKRWKQLSQLPYDGQFNLNSGAIYYGQHMDGVRDGYGLLYGTKDGKNPEIFECEWDKGSPITGIWLGIFKNQWSMYEGEIDKTYLRTGTGSWHNENGESYVGEYKKSKWHGNGKIQWKNGSSYEGEWNDHNKSGLGRYTEKKRLL
ncbi:hypothetical protein FGO68_gene10738 [Halteria grandinella]|uniref:Uncharacterized protein n=1 Tax=Halteria grandinella TaxID=5974 RepID=A0A8J8T9F9_HALGN|nr:hypothetical protein FGO68_gene10738 [Halteria grandinella]